MLRGLRGRSGVKAAESEPDAESAKAAHEGEASPSEPCHAGCAACSAAKGDDGLLTQGLVFVVLLLVSFAMQIRLLPRTRSASLPWNSSHPPRADRGRRRTHCPCGGGFVVLKAGE